GAARELERRALEGAKDVIVVGKLTVPKGHQGDAAVNNWIAKMMDIYRKIKRSPLNTNSCRWAGSAWWPSSSLPC
ncbi:MAG: hypothetical protein MUP13_08435, partial [Thermoanaerobaculales bacterium]|nr:hypothetical protein [Thermoanaerobaculales bacterium]